MNEWIGAAIAAMVGIVGGGVLRTVAVRAIGKEGRPEALRSSAGALGSLVFSLAVIAGLLVALGIIDPDSLEQLPEDLIAFAPKAISAAVLVIGANIAAAFATAALDRSLAGMPARARRRVTSGVRVALLGAAGLLAAGQLGVNTTVLNLAAAAIFFSVGASFALLSGLGGRDVAAEIAAGRAISRMLHEGDEITIGDRHGVVSKIHPAAIELAHADGTITLVPHSQILDQPIPVRRRSI